MRPPSENRRKRARVSARVQGKVFDLKQTTFPFVPSPQAPWETDNAAPSLDIYIEDCGENNHASPSVVEE